MNFVKRIFLGLALCSSSTTTKAEIKPAQTFCIVAAAAITGIAVYKIIKKLVFKKLAKQICEPVKVDAEEICVNLSQIKHSEQSYIIKQNLNIFFKDANKKFVKIQAMHCSALVQKLPHQDAFSIIFTYPDLTQKNFWTGNKTVLEILERYLIDSQ